MGEITRQPARAIQNALIDSVLAGLCALIVFGPIVGVVLKGYGFTLAPARVAILVAVVMAGRLALSLLLQSHRGKAFIARFEGADDGVYVRPPGYRSRLRWIIPLLVGLAIVFPFLATKYLLTVAILGLIYVLLGLGLNIVVGLAGLLDLGYVAFYAIGAYGLALGYQYLGLGFWAMLPLGAVSIFYGRVVSYLTERFGLLTDIFRFLPLRAIFPQMAGTALLLGCGIGFGVSFLTIRKHLRV